MWQTSVAYIDIEHILAAIQFRASDRTLDLADNVDSFRWTVVKGWQLPKMQKYIPDLPLP